MEKKINRLVINPTCSNCAFFNKGKCHFLPPAKDLFGSSFPVVLPDDWCAQWKPDATSEAEIKSFVENAMADNENPQDDSEGAIRKRGPGNA